MIALTILAAVLRVRLAWFLVVGFLLCAAGAGYLAYGPTDRPLQTVGRSATGPLSQQPAGQSDAGRSEPGPDKSDPQRAAEIEHTEHPASVSEPQREKIRQTLARLNPNKVD